MTAESLAERLAATGVAGEEPPAATSPSTILIFGGAGDLARRKLLPALYNLHVDGLLPARFAVVGTGRQELTDEAYRAFAREGVEQFSRQRLDPGAWQLFTEHLYFVTCSLEAADAMPRIGARLDTIEHEHHIPGN